MILIEFYCLEFVPTEHCSPLCIYIAVTLPKVHYNAETSIITVDEDIQTPLTVFCKPIATSFAIFNDDTILADPCGEEESLSNGTVTVIIANDELHSIHKPGNFIDYCQFFLDFEKEFI